MPDSPAVSRFQMFSVPIPSGVTRPMPVTTTRFMLVAGVLWDRALRLPVPSAAASLVPFDEAHGVLDGDDLLGGVVGNLAPELFLESHHELDGVEAIGPEIVDEAGVFGHLGLVDAKMLHDDLFYSVGDIAHRLIPRRINALVGMNLRRSGRRKLGPIVAKSRTGRRRRSHNTDNGDLPVAPLPRPRSWPCRHCRARWGRG